MGIFESIEAIVDYAQETGLSLAEIMIEQEMRINRTSREAVLHKMSDALLAMENAYQRGITGEGVFSPTGLTGGNAVKMRKYRQAGKIRSVSQMRLRKGLVVADDNLGWAVTVNLLGRCPDINGASRM